jgi:hypothetical protein
MGVSMMNQFRTRWSDLKASTRNAIKIAGTVFLVGSIGVAGLPPTTLKGLLDTVATTTLNFVVPFNQATRINATTALIETGNANLLKDPGFESGTTNNVTISGGATATVNTTAKLTGNYGLDWDSNAAGQTATGTAITIPEGLKGKNAVVSCNIKTVSGTATHTLMAYDGTNEINPNTIVSIAGTSVRTSVNFTAPSSGTITWRAKSVASNEPEIYVDDCILEDAAFFNLSQVNQAQLLGTVKVTGCSAGWSISSPTTTPANFGTQTGCTYTVTGSLQAPATNVPGFIIPSGGPGAYKIEAIGSFWNNASGTSAAAQFRFSDGTNSSNDTAEIAGNTTSGTAVPVLTGTINETTSFSNATFQIQGSGSSTSAVPYIEGRSTHPLVFNVFYIPTQSQTAYRPDQTPASWSGYHDSTCSWGRTNTTIGDPATDGTCTLTEVTNRNFGTVTGSNSLPSITFTPPRAGRYFVCANAQVNSTTNLAALVTSLTDGTTVIAHNSSRIYTDGTNDFVTHPLCGVYNATSTASVTLKIQTAASSGTVTITAGGASRSAIEWSIFELDAPMAAPYLTGSVTSNTSGQERIERATVSNSSGTCSISSQSGSWATLNSSTAANGGCTINIAAGEFSGTPACFCGLSAGTQSTNNETCYITSQSSSAVTWRVYNTSNASQNESVNVFCMGPR